jgi:hypothetical protein
MKRRHTHTLYDGLKRKEAIVLAQLRTGMTRLNSSLSKIGAAESDLCICGRASETVRAFSLLLHEVDKTERAREGMLQCTDAKRKALVLPGGKSTVRF